MEKSSAWRGPVRSVYEGRAAVSRGLTVSYISRKNPLELAGLGGGWYSKRETKTKDEDDGKGE